MSIVCTPIQWNRYVHVIYSNIWTGCGARYRSWNSVRSTSQRRNARRLDCFRGDLTECDEYHERLQVVAEQAITFDLDDGIPHNHALFGDILTKLK